MGDIRNVRVLTEAALSVALAFVLSFIKLLDLPFGGSISLEMVPLILFALRQGAAAGILTGAVYGMLSLAVDPFIVHPVQVLFDYPVAFGALGLAGLFRPTTLGTVLGTLFATAARFAAHFVSGVVFFAAYAPEGWNPLVYSAVYNAVYLVPSLVIAVVGVRLLLAALERARPSRRQLEARESAARPRTARSRTA
ncbi:MAG: energy-coupled thiamine transporter ThiT [Rubrobacter sp.]|nr:energy-coupled thiamine transporter ThiT [Rubrobacter sp.]